MKNVLVWVGGIVALALIAFGGGAFWQWSKANAAIKAEEMCLKQNQTAKFQADYDAALLALYRARIEIIRANFGNVGTQLSTAKQKIADSGRGASALPLIEKALAASSGLDPNSGEAIQAAIGALESLSAPPAPSAP